MRHQQTHQQAEHIRRGALSAGDLVDVSAEASSIGIRLPVTIRAQFSAIARAATERDWQDIRPLWEAFQRLDDGSPPGGLVDLADSPGHTITWQ